jgi:hypothetical protein
MLWKVLGGDGKGRKPTEGTRSVEKYLVTTMSRKLDMRSLNTRRSPAVQQVKMSLITQIWHPGHDITPLLGPLGVEDTHVRWISVKAPSSMLT